MNLAYSTTPSAVPVIGELRGRKHEYTATGNDGYDDCHPAAKRRTSYYLCNSTATVWSDIAESSPKSPESGIDMSDLGSSPCYSVPRTSTHLQYDLVPEVSTMSTQEFQQDQFKNGFYLAIVDEPEENYRARYDSEGCRGPMKGRNGGCPTVKITSNQHHWTDADIKVELVAADKSPLNSCKLDSTEEGANLLKKAHPGEKVSFENLRIRRLKKGDANNKGVGRQLPNQSKLAAKTTRGKQDEKVAHLLFTAKIRVPYSEDIELKVLSQAIHLNASHDPPEIHYVVPQYGSNGDPLAIIGTRMHSPRVSFIVNVDGKEQEIPADINKEVSHQNALVVKIPQLPLNSYANSIASAHICVTAGKGDRSGKEPLKSMLVPFYCVMQGVCKECVMTSQAQHQPSLIDKFSGFMFQPQPSPYIFRQSHSQQPAAGQGPVLMTVPKPSMIAHTPGRVVTPPNCISPLPAAVSKSPGYNSPPPSQPNGSYKMQMSNCTSSYPSYPVSCIAPIMNSCTSSPSLITTMQSSMDPSSTHRQQQQQQQSPDEVDDIISSFCDQPNPSDGCPITPGSVSHSPQTSASPPCYITSSPNSVMHPSDQLMEEIGFSEQQAGPVSPDEFNRYLPKHSQVISAPFGPVSTVSSSSTSSSTLGEYTSVSYYSSASGVQPSSLGQLFSQNP